MKKIAALFLCMALLLTGCSGGSGNGKDTEGEEKNTTQAVEEPTTQAAESTTAAGESSSDNTADPGSLVEIPFGCVLDSGYEEYMTLKMPASTIFISGTTKDNVTAEGSGKTCGEFAPNADSADLIAASFTDNELFGGAVSVEDVVFSGEFEDNAAEFREGTKSNMTGFTFEENSGESGGFMWTELFGTDGSGTYAYYLLVDMGDQVEFCISLYGAKGTMVNSMATAHDYFLGAITKTAR